MEDRCHRGDGNSFSNVLRIKEIRNEKNTKKNDSNPVCKGVIWLPVNVIVAAKYGTFSRLLSSSTLSYTQACHPFNP